MKITHNLMVYNLMESQSQLSIQLFVQIEPSLLLPEYNSSYFMHRIVFEVIEIYSGRVKLYIH